MNAGIDFVLKAAHHHSRGDIRAAVPRKVGHDGKLTEIRLGYILHETRPIHLSHWTLAADLRQVADHIPSRNAQGPGQEVPRPKDIEAALMAGDIVK